MAWDGTCPKGTGYWHLQQKIRWRADWASLRSGFGISKLQFIKIRPEKENCFGTIEAHSHLPYRVASVLIQSCWR
jgi:hypothetical protein